VTSRQGAAHGSAVGIGAPNDPMYTLTSKQHGVMQPPSAVVTFDARGNGDGSVVNTLAGDHANRVTDYTPLVQQPIAINISDGIPSLAQYTRTLGVNSGAPRGVGKQMQAVLGTGPLPYHPRRLMPVECERLMSWPDGWTATGIDEQGREYALSDTARYRLCGNGVASVVSCWIGLRLAAALGAQVPMREAA
jgi:site-specific DNA-cytosine methylase